MTYTSIVEMAQSESLLKRVTACVAQQGISSPQAWASSNMWKLATSPGWADDWDYAKGTYNVNQNPDFGKRNDIIDDGQILSAVQAAAAPTP